jgi:16S rRNA (guanine527-N7)-methyltransferase
MVIAENEHQNLISLNSVLEFDLRHIADAAQLRTLRRPGSWCDIGSGAGIPGMVIAILGDDPVTLVEPRRLRAQFLCRAAAELGIDVEVVQQKAEQFAGQFDNITARAVADTSKLFAMTQHLAHRGTRWILPKGRSAKKELEAAQQSWQGSFTLVPSRTSDEAMILVAEDVRRRGKR